MFIVLVYRVVKTTLTVVDLCKHLMDNLGNEDGYGSYPNAGQTLTSSANSDLGTTLHTQVPLEFMSMLMLMEMTED